MRDEEASEALALLVSDHQYFHSELQMDHFITTRAGGCHPWGMYVQALRELESRHGAYHNLVLRRRRLALEIQELELEVSRWRFTRRGRIRRRRARLELEEKQLGVRLIARMEPDREREFRRFFAQALAIREVLGDLTPERKRELDEDMWHHRLRQVLAIDFYLEGAPGASIMSILPALPRRMREALRNDIKNPAPLVEWYTELKPQETVSATNGSIQGVDLERLVLGASCIAQADRDGG